MANQYISAIPNFVYNGLDQLTNLYLLHVNDENQLLETLKSYVSHSASANQENDQTQNERMVQDCITKTKLKQSECQNCKCHSDEISKTPALK